MSERQATATGQIDFQAIFEGVPGLYLILDPDLEIVAVSDAYLAATMTVREEILGRGVFEVFPDNPDDEQATGTSNLGASLQRVRDLRRPDAMAVQKYDIQRPRSEGGGFEVRYWSPVNSPVLDAHGQLRYIVHRVEDVTEFVTMREAGDAQAAEASELREQTARMQAEILRRSAQLHEANVQLRAANEAKTKFLSGMSHELRTPLNAISGFSELLVLADLEPEHKQWAETILRASRHLTGLVDEVLQISRIEAGKLTLSLEPVALDPVVSDVLTLVAPLAQSSGITVHPPAGRTGPGYAFADNQRLKQVLINLVVNAIKYNRPGGEVRIDVESDDGDLARIVVSDTGPGIDAEALPKLFVAFERLGAGESSVEGSGLGLALSRDLVEAMGGSIDVQSTVGVGTTFTVELPSGESPAALPDPAESQAPVEVRGYDRELKLLYIEDTVTNVRLIEAILRKRPSVRLIPAMMGRLGLDLAREHHPDLILLDLHLPDMDGDEVLAQLRRDEATEQIPVVVLSADATTGRDSPLLDAGAQAFMTKPIGVRELISLVDRTAGVS